jgi:hypothetical protein
VKLVLLVGFTVGIYNNFFFLLAELSAASTSDDNTAKVRPVFMAKVKMSQCLGFRPQVCLGGEG